MASIHENFSLLLVTALNEHRGKKEWLIGNLSRKAIEKPKIIEIKCSFNFATQWEKSNSLDPSKLSHSTLSNGVDCLNRICHYRKKYPYTTRLNL